MSGKRVQQIKRAIGELTQEELEELRLWLDEYAGPSPLDLSISTDLFSGKLDKAIENVLDDEKHSRVRPL